MSAAARNPGTAAPHFASAFALGASADSKPDEACAASEGGSLHPGYEPAASAFSIWGFSSRSKFAALIGPTSL